MSVEYRSGGRIENDMTSPFVFVVLIFIQSLPFTRCAASIQYANTEHFSCTWREPLTGECDVARVGGDVN